MTTEEKNIRNAAKEDFYQNIIAIAHKEIVDNKEVIIIPKEQLERLKHL